MSSDEGSGNDDPTRQFVRAAGFALLLLGIDYFLIPFAFALSNPDMEAATATTRDIAHAFLSNPRTAVLPMTILSSIGGVLYVPAIVGLYFALKDYRRANMVISALLTLTMVPLILVQNVFSISVMGVSADYLAADPELQHSMLSAATMTVTAYFKIEFFIVLLFSVATLLLGSAMRRGGWSSKLVAVVMTAGVANIIGQGISVTLGHTHPAGAGIAFLGLFLNIVWFLWVGARLVRL